MFASGFDAGAIDRHLTGEYGGDSVPLDDDRCDECGELFESCDCDDTYCDCGLELKGCCPWCEDDRIEDEYLGLR